jgi:hypothetical protein
MAFPISPTEGQTHTENNTVWIYSAVTDQWNRSIISQVNETTYIGSDGAPGGIGGNTQVIFNDNGSLASDAGLVYNKTTDVLTTGSLRATSLGTAAAPGIAFETDPNTGIYSPGADQLAVATNGVERVKFGGAVIFNDGSTDTDFRIEGVTDANLFFVDASTNRVGVGTSSPAQLLDVRGDAQIGQTGQNSLNIRSSAGSGQFIYFTEHAIADRWLLGSSAGSGDLVARSGAYNFSTGSERLRITAAGLVGVGTSSPVTTLTVKGPTNGNVVTLFGSSGDSARKLVISNSDNDNDWDIDANRGTYGALSLSTGGTKRLQIDASGNVGIGTTSPAMPLSVKADLSRNAIQIINGGSGTEEGRLYWYASNASTIRAGISGQENGLVFFHGAGVTERARIDSSGRLGIGTSAPTTILHASINSSAEWTSSEILSGSTNIQNTILTLYNSNNTINGVESTLLLSAGGSGTAQHSITCKKTSATVGDLIFRTRAGGGSTSSELMRLTGSGRLGIGTTSPATTLDVNGDVTITDKIIHGGDTNTAIRFPATDTVSVETAGSERARIDSSGRLLVGTGSDSGGALFQVNGDRIRVGTAKTPATSGATGTTGEIAWDADYIYVCTATNTWKRSAIATW